MDYRDRWELKDYLIGRTLSRRIVVMHIAVVAILLTFLLRFWYMQGLHGEEYALLAENNRLRRLPMSPARGVISDRHGTVIAATRPSLSLVLLREGAQGLATQIERVASVLGTSAEVLGERLERMRGRPQFEPLVLQEDIALTELARIESRREIFHSIEVEQSALRSYPHAGVFAHVLGYVGEVTEAQISDGSGVVPLQLGDIVGKAGIERHYDSTLRGSRGWRVVSVNNLGRRMGAARVGREPEHGRDVQLTLDAAMQQALAEGLGEEVGAGVFLDPWTGEVLALVSTPAFDPNMFAAGLSQEQWRAIHDDSRNPLLDRAISSYYAPGSTFKVLMAVAGLETGTVRPEDRVYCNGSAMIYGHRRLCWKKGGHGSVDLRHALAHSCNVYFYLLGQRLGIEPIHRHGERFSLGRPTGIDLPHEARGVLPSADWKQRTLGTPWFAGDTISVAIGQGLLTVTPIQMATLISGVATGSIPRPRLLREGGSPPTPVNVRPENLAVVRSALRDAVETGTGRRGDLTGIGVAGKTGTAQVFKRSAGIDADELPKAERDHAWFVGYAPYDRPRVAFAVVVEHGGHGGTTAAPIARRVLEVFFEAELEAQRGESDQRAGMLRAGELRGG